MHMQEKQQTREESAQDLTAVSPVQAQGTSRSDKAGADGLHAPLTAAEERVIAHSISQASDLNEALMLNDQARLKDLAQDLSLIHI